MTALADTIRHAAGLIEREPDRYNHGDWQACGCGYLWWAVTGEKGSKDRVASADHPAFRLVVEAVARADGWTGVNPAFPAQNKVSRAIFDSVPGYPFGRDAARWLREIADLVEQDERFEADVAGLLDGPVPVGA